MPSPWSPTDAVAQPSPAASHVATTPGRSATPPDAQADFWRLSQATYAPPGVSAACIELQDINGADVNLLLLALRAASRGEAVGVSEVIAAEHATHDWRTVVVRPFRAVRRELRAFDALGLRKMVAEAELEAARLQQETPAATVPRPLSDLPALPRGLAYDVARKAARPAIITRRSLGNTRPLWH